MTTNLQVSLSQAKYQNLLKGLKEQNNVFYAFVVLKNRADDKDLLLFGFSMNLSNLKTIFYDREADIKPVSSTVFSGSIVQVTVS